jgi:hypothetical protein
MTTQNATLDSKRTLSRFISYRRLSSQFQFSLSAVTLGYPSQWYTLAGRRGGGGSIFWKTPDTALYSTCVSTL